MKRLLRNSVFLLFGIFFIASTLAMAQVTVTPADATNIPGTSAANGSSPAWTTLGDIVIASNGNNNAIAKNQTGVTLILTAPTNWSFNSGVGSGSVSGTAITYVGISVSSTTITFTFSRSNNNSSDATITISGIQVQEIDGSTTSQGLILRTSANSGTAIITGITVDVTSFGTLSGDGVLPVELTSFTGYANGSVVTLNWATATEVNNYGFEVYRDGAKVGFVQGHGNSNSPKNYSFTDKPAAAKTFSYQLKQVDFSGLSKLYGPVLVKVDVPAAFVLHQNYPNPYNPSTTIKYEVPFTDKITLKVYNLIGQEVATLFEGVKEAGAYEVKFNGSNLASGIYLYSLTSSTFTKNIKMLLLK